MRCVGGGCLGRQGMRGKIDLRDASLQPQSADALPQYATASLLCYIYEIVHNVSAFQQRDRKASSSLRRRGHFRSSPGLSYAAATRAR